jgi:hemerythrin-like domain-containing protein
MEIISELRQEHEQFEREFLELEEIIGSEEINYSNLVHVLKKVYLLWDSHEKKEERVFEVLAILEIEVPFERFSFEHKKLKPHKDKLNSSIMLGDESLLKESFEDLKEIIRLLREHINSEDEVLYTYPFTDEELIRIEKLI